MFLLQAETWLRAMEQLQSEMLDFCRNAFVRGCRDQDFLRLDRETFFACPADSIDYAVMEKISTLSDLEIRGIMVSLDAGWSDVGAWDAVWQIGEKDDQGNSAYGDVFLEDSKNSLILATSRLVSCVGIDRMVIIETSDAVLIADKDQVQNVKKIVATLKMKRRREGTSHPKVFCPWGWHDSLVKGEGFQVKRIVVNPGAILSLQFHHHRSEHWIVVRGVARITLGEETILLTENQSIFIPVGKKPRRKPGQVPWISLIFRRDVSWRRHIVRLKTVMVESKRSLAPP